MSESKPDGWDLLKPFDQIPVWDQTDLLETVKPLIAAAESKGGLDLANTDLRVIGDAAKQLRQSAVDDDAFMEFASGSKALNRIIDLAVWFVGQLGESERSATS